MPEFLYKNRKFAGSFTARMKVSIFFGSPVLRDLRMAVSAARGMAIFHPRTILKKLSKVGNELEERGRRWNAENVKVLRMHNIAKQSFANIANLVQIMGVEWMAHHDFCR